LEISNLLKKKSSWLRAETLKLHGIAPEARVASCMSCIEIFVSLYYGGLIDYDTANLEWEERDRLVVSKGHGSVCLYPLLADIGFFDASELAKIGRSDTFLCVIPDPAVPGFETINGSLGHGLGVACGMALGLKRKSIDSNVYVLCGDGELNEGSMWEAAMFAAFHKLDNLILIVDNNKISMLGFQKDIIGIEPISEKFEAFGWKTQCIDGHNVDEVFGALQDARSNRGRKPKVVVADTVKGKGIPSLENKPLCHVMSVKSEEIDRLIAEGM